MNRTSVLLLFGGESSEHDVSISSARNVYAALDNEKYDVMFGYIDKYGKWWLLRQFGIEISHHDAPQLVPVLGSHGFTTLPNGRIIRPDVILPILHGKNGEDGSVQALARLLHIPIVGCDMTASALCMDKVAAKEIISTHDIPTVPFRTYHKGQPIPQFNDIVEHFGDIVFVKPSRAGSSVGVSKVQSADEFREALLEATRHDAVALIEKAVTAREISVAVLGTPPKHRVSTPGEALPDGEFYSYDLKYGSTSTSTIKIPADISSEQQSTIKEYAARAYEALGCSGMAQIDFFLSDDDTIYFNEINTIPGFTNTSMYPKMWRYDGLSYPALFDTLIKDALRVVQ